ncbi:hypothetical protein [Moorena bouillonii]|uniref:hypothetical protein n=1 Tax=Moorena bouillonii TaxID=207920 RepID=UPI00117C955D|nr:hypothetical protein [Moorena bouillonii]
MAKRPRYANKLQPCNLGQKATLREQPCHLGQKATLREQPCHLGQKATLREQTCNLQPTNLQPYNGLADYKFDHHPR